MLAAIRLLASQKSALGHALHAVSSCGKSVAALTAGSDSAGSVSILACLSRGLAALGRVHLSSLAESTALASRRGTIESAFGNVSLAQSELQKAQSDIQAVNLPASQVDLDAAASALRRAVGVIGALERALKHTR
jgi:hypothetical protein